MKWSFRKPDGLKWPKDENGEPVAPAYLKHISGGPLDLQVALSLLEAYGIPHVSEYPNNGAFGKLIFGHPPSGMEIFVPETMLEDAQNILTAEVVEEDEEEEDNEDENDM
ncbi:MAG: DUF2007 domain-containing protein [Oscillospiraceae bacterium]|nr:DUF2007 domain-containing protein [Oscillospiraceae bacterium]